MHLHCTPLLVRYLPRCHRLFHAYSIHFMITPLATASFLRSLACFGFPLFAPTIYSTLDYGKGDTILAFAAIALGCPACVKAVACLFHCICLTLAQSMATLVLRGANTKCQPLRA